MFARRNYFRSILTYLALVVVLGSGAWAEAARPRVFDPAWGNTTAPAPTDEQLSPDEVYERTLAATGWILAEVDDENTMSGTCWVVDREARLVVTARHCVGDERQVVVYFPQVRRGRVVTDPKYYQQSVEPVRGRVLEASPSKDLAVIRLDRIPRGVEELPLAMESPRPGEQVYTIGNHYQHDSLWDSDSGRVAQVGYQVMGLDNGQRVRARLITTRSHFIHGNSGGPLVNGRGELVGVVMALNEELGINTSVDVSEVRKFLDLDADDAPPAEVAAVPVVGEWTVAMHKDAPTVDVEVGMTFDDNGHVLIMAGPNPMSGTYQYVNGRLTLTLPGEAPETGRVRWEGDSRFSVDMGGYHLEFERA